MTPRAWWPAWGYLALALAVATAAPLLWWVSWPEPEGRVGPPLTAPTSAPSNPTQTRLAVAAVPTTPPAPLQTVLPPGPPAVTARVREPDSDPTPDLADYLNPGETPTMTEVITRLHQAGVRSGLGAFQPPGTRPPLVGIAVPEDFPLPPGYVRHHQATDDGQRIEAILMFAPDLQLYDTAGRPVPMPVDRVVPPELAPPGLPIRRIVVPAPLDRGR